MTPTATHRLEDLSDRVLAGDVVFFVGAGFSLDSEGNSGWRMVARLVARFFGMHEALTKPGVLLREAAVVGAAVKDLHRGLLLTFGLGKLLDTRDYPGIIRQLSASYYQINDWICSAFGEITGFLAGDGVAADALDRIVAAINTAENIWLRRFNSDETVPLPPIALAGLEGLPPSLKGKALFLDTQGFRDPAIMGGGPELPTGGEVAASYGHRLRPRHHALARLAREGLCPTLITTNFDLLLEGAYRLSGFRQPGDATADGDDLPPTRHPDFARIATAAQFYYGRGSRAAGRGGQRTAHIVKIHGCADGYKRARTMGAEALRAILPSLVFTFREVQNWRTDSWSRDLVHTLLRTRTMVFSGYSAADPVLHDTLRTVYEEMAATGERLGPALRTRSTPERSDAPAFFLGRRNSAEFHALEVLRASSRAVGVADPELARHPNYLEFGLIDDAAECFPRVDELMGWLFHRVYRKRQAGAARSDLRSIATLVLGHPPRQVEVERVWENFDRILTSECGAAGGWLDTPSDDRAENARRRAACARVTAWSWAFHPHLLRELALADLVLRHHGPGVGLGDLRAKPWYYPAGDNHAWTAWGVVVEVALRRMAAAQAGQPAVWANPDRWSNPAPALEPTACVLPSVALSAAADRPAPLCLTLGFDGFGRVGRHAPVEGLYRRRVFWTLRMDRLPWTPADRRTPDAGTLWRWASAPADEVPGPIDGLKDFFGESDDQP